MGKPIPYRVRRNAVVRCKTGFLRTFDTGQAQKPYRHNFNAPLKCGRKSSKCNKNLARSFPT